MLIKNNFSETGNGNGEGIEDMDKFVYLGPTTAKKGACEQTHLRENSRQMSLFAGYLKCMRISITGNIRYSSVQKIDKLVWKTKNISNQSNIWLYRFYNVFKTRKQLKLRTFDD